MSNARVEVKPFEVQALEAVECGKVVLELGQGVGGEPPSEVVAKSDRPYVGRDTATHGVYLRPPFQKVVEGGDRDGFKNVPLTATGPCSCGERARFEVSHLRVPLAAGDEIDDLVHELLGQHRNHRALGELLSGLEEPGGGGHSLYNVAKIAQVAAI